MTEYMNQIFNYGSQCALLSRFKATSRGCLHTHLNGGHLWTVETWFTPLKTALMDRIYQPRNKPLTPKHIFLFGFSVAVLYVPCTRHYNLLLIWNRSWILTVHKVIILQKKSSLKNILAFKNGVKSIQTAAYNGAGMVV